MKVKGVDLKDITIRPLPFQLPGMKSVKSVKYMRLKKAAKPAWPQSQGTLRSTGAKSIKGIRIRERDFFLTLFLAGFVLGVFYITVFGKEAVHNT